ncbi:MAG TPA: mechanosensitive ion channel domain-containing protein [Candidatus Acidoferrum sp.]|jgi:small-conductance mechanosensitive channel
MKNPQKIATVILIGLIAATVYGIVRTRSQSGLQTSEQVSAGDNQTPTVDETPLFTARRLAQMPTSAQEQAFAVQALHLADKEMDLAFAAALRKVTDHPPVLSAEAKAIQQRLQQAESAFDAVQARVAQLTAAQAKATGARQDELNDQLDLAKAQAELNQDQVDDAKEDLIRAGGDPQSRIQAMVQEHEEASKLSDTTHVAISVAANARGLIHRFQQWSALHEKQLQLWQAKQQAESAAERFSREHSEIENRLNVESRKSSAAAAPRPNQIAKLPGTVTGVVDPSRAASAAMVRDTRLRDSDRKDLAGLDKRIDDQKSLAAVYGKWIEAVAAEQRVTANLALRGVLLILAIALAGLFFEDWIGRLLSRMSMDRRQLQSLHTVTRVTLQVIAVLFILLVIFGPPGQLGTFLGLAGAGLTVALKDFIVGFLGWFVLMGKNGIRLGDWVEINGVTGEVVELGMFHTVLLETGNWTDSGHPTGRRVTFTNSFAIEGHYFNFSTSGQWLWDELQIVLPSGQNPYPIVEAIQKKVLEATSEGALKAQQEWQGAAKSRDMGALSAAPAINVKPVIGGTEIAVRYITQAHERAQLRAKLNQAAVDLLGQKSPGAEVEVRPAKVE